MTYTLQDLLKEPGVVHKTYLGNWLREASCSMLYGWRGVGKSWVAMSIAWAAASGSGFLGFGPGTKRPKVFYFDSELGKNCIRERFQAFIPHHGKVGNPDLLDIIPRSFDQLPRSEVPNLGDPDTHGFWLDLLSPYDVLVLDNISGIVRQYKRENEAETWTRVQSFLNKLRSNGKAILLIHHAGKSGAQRGTSVREDNLDFVLALQSAKRLGSSPGAVFEFHFEKMRDIWRPEYKSLWVSFDGSQFAWEFEELDKKLISRAVSLSASGLVEYQIAQVLGMSGGELRELCVRHDVKLKKGKDESERSPISWSAKDASENF
jgi:hypothetical protein